MSLSATWWFLSTGWQGRGALSRRGGNADSNYGASCHRVTQVDACAVEKHFCVMRTCAAWPCLGFLDTTVLTAIQGFKQQSYPGNVPDHYQPLRFTKSGLPDIGYVPSMRASILIPHLTHWQIEGRQAEKMGKTCRESHGGGQGKEGKRERHTHTHTHTHRERERERERGREITGGVGEHKVSLSAVFVVMFVCTL
jgi:hypothetical protein